MAFGLFKKKSKKKSQEQDDRYMNVHVKEVVNIAKDAVNIVFEAPEGFTYEPGQFITIIQEVNGKKIRRAYSLCTTAFVDKDPAVTVKRVPNGQMSNYLNDHVKTGNTLEIMEAMGQFVTSYHPDNERNIVLFGGGSGITPLISIGKSILDKEPKSNVSLVYGNRSEEYVIFKELLAELSTKHGDRFRVTHILEEGEADYSGRPNEEMLVEICDKLGCDQQTQFFICGPQPMMDLVYATLENKSYPKENIKIESFEVAKTPEISSDKKGSKSTVTIVLDGEEREIKIGKNDVILHKALDKEIDMPYSCQAGLCTACRGKCVEGKVTTEDAEGLSQEELDEGYVLTCVARPLSDTVRIEMD